MKISANGIDVIVEENGDANVKCASLWPPKIKIYRGIAHEHPHGFVFMRPSTHEGDSVNLPYEYDISLEKGVVYTVEGSLGSLMIEL